MRLAFNQLTFNDGWLEIDGMPLHVLDTAGLRGEAADAVEAEGMRRTRDEIARADRVLFVVDAAADASAAGGLPPPPAASPATTSPRQTTCSQPSPPECIPH